MNQLARLVVVVSLVVGALAGFALAAPGCCNCPEVDLSPFAPFSTGTYEVVRGWTPGTPTVDGFYEVTTESVVLEYEDEDANSWVVTYDVVCGNFDVEDCGE